MAAAASPNPNSPPVEVKLFVGRVPRSADESQLKPVFEQCGEVSEVSVIQGKDGSGHKGCAFVRMKEVHGADRAVKTIGGHKTLEGSTAALVVKYAQGENERLGFFEESAKEGDFPGKLFVGGLPRNVTDETVRDTFLQYGSVEDVYVMRDDQKSCKGSAFVKMSFKQDALHAISSLSGKTTLDGSTRPLEVRFAESKKAQAQAQQMRQGAFGGGGMPQGGGIPPPKKAWTEYFTQDGRPYYHNSLTCVTQWERPVEMDGPPRMQPPMGGGYMMSQQSVPAAKPMSNVPMGQTHGPPGANVFVFNIPNEWAENDLQNQFQVFGNLVSVRLQPDRATGRHRGFGFVSYDNIPSALAAVSQMNGFAVSEDRRLKVEIKKGEEQHAAASQQGQAAVAGGNRQAGVRYSPY